MSDGLEPHAQPVEAASDPEAGHRVPRSTTMSDRWLWLGLTVVRLGPALILIILLVVLAIAAPFFATEHNVQNILTQSAVIALLAVGQLLVVVVRNIDASVGSIVGLTTVVGAMVYDSRIGGGATVVGAMLLTGALVGLINGLVYVYGRLPNSLINTLASLFIVQGLAQAISHDDTISGMPPVVTRIGGGFVGAVPAAALLVLVVAILTSLLCRKTKWGRWVFAIGGSPEAARRVGIPVNKVLVSVFVASGLLAAMGGIVVAGQTDAGYGLAGGSDLVLNAIAAVFIGGASFHGGRGTVGGALVGAFIIGCLRNGLDLLNVYPTYQLVAVGAVMLVAVELDVLRGYLEGRFRVAQATAMGAGTA